jgi:branched-chain amino acid transport system ATP-binding protein
MANPALLLCDEISLGLSPAAIEQIYASFHSIRGEGTSIILVEQDVKRAASATDRIYCLLEGHVTLEGPSRNLDADALTRAYFGT